MIPDRRRRRIRGFLSHLTWPLRRGWTKKDQNAFAWEIVWKRLERKRKRRAS